MRPIISTEAVHQPRERAQGDLIKRKIKKLMRAGEWEYSPALVPSINMDAVRHSLWTSFLRDSRVRRADIAALVETSGFNVRMVVTQPDSPRGADGSGDWSGEAVRG